MARPIKHDGGLFKRAGSKVWWMQYREKGGQRRRESTGAEDWDEAQKRLRERLQARDNNTLPALRKGKDLAFAEWSEFYLENFSKPPFRAKKHLNAVFGGTKLADLTAEEIEMYLRHRLAQRVRVKAGGGIVEKGLLKATTVHQELRVLRRMLNVAVRKRFLAANPCAGVEFPARVDGLFRPHYMGWSEQQQIEFQAPEYMKNLIRIVTETGLRIYKELAPMKKENLDLENGVAWIPDSKTPNGVAEVPLTPIAIEAFRRQIELSGPGPYLFPSVENPGGYQKSFKTAWRASLRRAGVQYFRIYDLRSTYATRLSAGGVADEFVTQLLRQGDAKVFKKYSQLRPASGSTKSWLQ
ncbi:tyrosine-type recombinase/integrase [uncultured Paludibaculum sp.]|uniref:tyrosine-type recombinase/integrase n=1 Tax=uncultured Paludibaculum sp. TaxID=1765020 RepID=UPI002AABD219|nr:tyrosine-type recombinase/integrase [uncultured Paludibaculum sp.]